jgi:hypothetical protein
MLQKESVWLYIEREEEGEQSWMAVLRIEKR